MEKVPNTGSQLPKQISNTQNKIAITISGFNTVLTIKRKQLLRNKSAENLKYVVFQTKSGWVGLLASPDGLVSASFPRPSGDLAFTALGEIALKAHFSSDYFRNWMQEFEEYFHGRRTDFSGPLDLSGATPFEMSVWQTTKSIPYGQTQSYRWVARQIGKPLAPRAVGQALGRNPLPIVIPCHRVLTSDGRLGGFGGGLDMKQYLLDLEGGKHETVS
jgi:methylated-DNA-[protein]-cysteine S-methyltransferase